MGFNETAALIDTVVAFGFALIFGLVGFVTLRSNRTTRAAWKTLVGVVSILLTISGLTGAISPTRQLLAERSARLDYEASFEQTPTTGATSSTSTTTTTRATTTTRQSKYAPILDEAANAWAQDAIEYSETQDWRWNDREQALVAVARFAKVQCAALAWSDARLNAQSSTPEQVESALRQWVGMEGWDYFGEAWYDSLVNGLCIRR